MIPDPRTSFQRTELLERVRGRLDSAKIEDSKVLAAVSGGPDSMGMLAILVQELKIAPQRIVVCYVDHGIRPNMDSDRAVIRKFTDQHGITFRTAEVNVPEFARVQRFSLEAAARKLRYEALQREAESQGCSVILTGHTLDDSAETVLMRMLSGAPWYEWTGIPAKRGNIVRPLIDVYRYEIVDYINYLGIIPAQDETNFDHRFKRNQLRFRLKSSSYWTMEQIEILARSGELLDRYLKGLRSIASRITNYESKQVFTGCQPLAIKQILTYFSRIEFLPVEAAWATLSGNGEQRLPSALRRQISDCMLGSANHSIIRLPHGMMMERRGARVWVYAEDHVRVNEQVGIGETVVADLNRKLVLSEDAQPKTQNKNSIALDGRLNSNQLTLRNWQAGDRMKIRGRPTKKVSDLLAQENYTPVERSNALVLTDRYGPLVLLGKYIDERALPGTDCRTYLNVNWIPLNGE